MDVDPERPGIVLEEPEGAGISMRSDANQLSPPPLAQFEGSGEEDVDSDIGANPHHHQQHRPPGETYLYPSAVPIPMNAAATAGSTNPNNPFANNAGSAVGLGMALGGHWGSPGAGSSASARGDSPIPMNLGGGGPAVVGQVVVGGGGEDTELGVGVDGLGIGIDGETVNGKRKR